MKLLLCALALCAVVLATTQRTEISSPIESPYWNHVGRSAATKNLRLVVGLKDRNVHKMEKYVLEISDPNNHEMWGNHLNLEQVTDIMAPSSSKVAQFVEFLKSFGVEDESISIGEARSFIKVKASVQVFEQILNCEFHEYAHVASNLPNEHIHRCINPSSVPSEFGDLVAFVEPVHAFLYNTRSTYKASRAEFVHDVAPSVQSAVPVALANVTVTDLYERYNITLGQKDLKVNNSQGVFEDEDGYAPSDLQQFIETYIPRLNGQKVVGIRGNAGVANSTQGGDAEPILDLSMIMSTGAYAPTYFYNYIVSGPDDDGDDFFQATLDWANDLANDPKPPIVHSFSWGPYGGDYPLNYVYKISNEWMKLGARGISLLAASGDDGSGCAGGNITSFPYPSSPWITLVGSTQLQSSGANDYYEIGSTFSTGGFSSDYAQPTWQKTQVDWWLKNGNKVPPKNTFNASGRALPDFAAAGENILIVDGGVVQTVDGTSCSSPIAAGMFSLMNAERLSKGKKPLGYLNQILYTASAAEPTAFWDVTEGDNMDDDDGSCPGFYASKGWDPVTGLGTPNFQSLWDNYISKLA